MNNLTSLPIKDVMVSEVLTVDPSQPLREAFEILNAYNIHHLPVINDLGQVIGIISRHEVDVIHSWASISGQEFIALRQQQLIDSLIVSDVMHKEVTCVQADDLISACVEIFNKNKVHALPVIDDGILVGMITTYDLIRLAYD